MFLIFLSNESSHESSHEKVVIKYYPATNIHFISGGGVSVGGDSDSRGRSSVCTGVFLFWSGSGSGDGQVLFFDGGIKGIGSASG